MKHYPNDNTDANSFETNFDGIYTRYSLQRNRVSAEVADFHRRSWSVLDAFSVSVPGVVAIFANSLFAVAYCPTVTTTPVSRKRSKKKGKGRELLINKCALYQTNSQLVVHRHSFDRPPRECVTRFLYLLTNIRISPLINRGYVRTRIERSFWSEPYWSALKYGNYVAA